MKKEIFDLEIAICQKNNKKNDGSCNWGECEKCGVIPLLYKLSGRGLLEEKEDIKNVKKEILI